MSDLDPFDTDDEDPEPDSNATAAARRIENKMKKYEKEIEELRAYKAEQEEARKQATVQDAFKQAELNPKWAGFYSGEEHTPEAVRAWAIEQELIQPPEDEVAPSQGYTPTVIEAPSAPTAKTFTKAEMEQIARENPARAQSLVEQGRVVWNNPQVAER